ncbi:hypothetical protein GE09DRAFT_737893 [Coniochaeta sp. 2T2.1]|nr:hypothetical protein GE09DRAFT_737893 [Coniochaeta sp. 2T2.1]
MDIQRKWRAMQSHSHCDIARSEKGISQLVSVKTSRVQHAQHASLPHACSNNLPKQLDNARAVEVHVEQEAGAAFECLGILCATMSQDGSLCFSHFIFRRLIISQMSLAVAAVVEFVDLSFVVIVLFLAMFRMSLRYRHDKAGTNAPSYPDK